MSTRVRRVTWFGPYVEVEVMNDGAYPVEFTDAAELTALARELNEAAEWLTTEQMFGAQSAEEQASETVGWAP